MKCIKCNNKLTGSQTKFCSVDCLAAFGSQVGQHYDAQKKRGISRKLHLIERSGGKCSICGYNKNISSLCFHHEDPSTKSFELDIRRLSNNSMKTIEEEFKKCILLCHNCHNELHNPSLTLKNYENWEIKLGEATGDGCYHSHLLKLNSNEIDSIINDINEGISTLTWMAEKYDVTYPALKKFLVDKSVNNVLVLKEVKKRKPWTKATKIVWPTNEELLEAIKKSTYAGVARALGVFDNAIRKRLKRRGLI